MSGDLISRKALLNRFKYSETDNEIDKAWICTVRRIIKEHPTAFNKEKVIEQIREKVSDCYLEYCGKYNNCLQCRADEAVKIVEKGGIE